MATSKSYFSRQNYRFLPGGPPPLLSDGFELDEFDVYGVAASNSPEFRKPLPATRIGKKNPSAAARAVVGGTAASLPVNIPDWSKILKEEYRDNRRRDMEDDDDGRSDGGEGYFEGGGNRVPPHELLARTRIASFSVHEGIGRTLKGRDLSRVRNAIWEKTGFED